MSGWTCLLGLLPWEKATAANSQFPVLRRTGRGEAGIAACWGFIDDYESHRLPEARDAIVTSARADVLENRSELTL